MTEKDSIKKVKTEKVREAVGVFKDSEALDNALTALEHEEFPRHTISMLGRQEALEDTFGDTAVEPKEIMDDPETPRKAPVHEEELAEGAGALIGGGLYVGAIAAALAAGAVSFPAAVGAAAVGGVGGATAGGVLAKIFGEKYDEEIEQQIEEGGLLLWVQTSTPDKEEKACQILKDHGAEKVHVHEIR